MTYKYEEYQMKYKAQGGMNTVRRPRLVMRTPSDFTVNASSENLSLHRPCKAIHFPTLRYSQLNSLKISFNIVSLCLAVQEPLKLIE